MKIRKKQLDAKTMKAVVGGGQPIAPAQPGCFNENDFELNHSF